MTDLEYDVTNWINHIFYLSLKASKGTKLQ